MPVLTLARLELVNLFGINELRHAKDPAVRRRKRLMLGIFLLLAVVLVAYVAIGSLAIAWAGLADKIPMLYLAAAILFDLFFGIYQARSCIYREKDLEQVSALPVKGMDVVVSRVMKVYVENLLLTALILLPAMLVYGLNTGCGPAVYIMLTLVIVIVPIIPTTVATWLGIAVAAIIARNRHKVLTEVLLTFVLLIGLFLIGAALTANSGVDFAELDFSMSEEEVAERMSALMGQALMQTENTLLPMKMMGDALKNADVVGLLLYALLSFAVFIPTLAVIGRCFFGISERLFVREQRGEYRLERLEKNSVMAALVKKESARYFSSGLYISNTIFGPALAVVVAIALGFFRLPSFSIDAGGLTLEIDIYAGIPYIFGVLFCLVSISSSSVSVEGKTWWLLRALPLRSKEVLRAKLQFNLMVVTPFYALVEVIMLFTVQAGSLERLLLIVVPGVSLLLSVLLGLFLNLKFPKFNWETEAEVIKQGAAIGFGMLAGLAVVLFGMGAMAMPAEFLGLYGLGFTALTAAICLLLYRSICRANLEELGE